jgi:xyloglucan-specific endo-beta-1,4-glucanase
VEWSWDGAPNNVKSYPYSGRDLEHGGKKKLVSNIASIWTKAEWDYRGDNIRANVAYDLFTAKDRGRDNSGGDYELMIWLGNYGGVHPIGSSKGHSTINGLSWELYVGMNGDMKVFSFVAAEHVKGFEGDLRPFFAHMTEKHGFPAHEQHLTSELV